MAQPRRKALDGFDAEAVREMTESGGWRLVRSRIEKTLVEKMEALVNPSSEVETAKLRGEIAGLRTALRIPEILQSEGQKNSTGD